MNGIALLKKLTIFAFLMVQAGGVFAEEADIVDVTSVSSGLSIVANGNIQNLTQLSVRIMAPDGSLILNSTSSNGSVAWQVGSNPDGDYRWEAVILSSEGEVDEAADASSPTGRESGSFKVENGLMVLPPTAPALETEVGEENAQSLWQGFGAAITKIAGVALEMLVPSAHAAPLTASDPTFANIFYDATTLGTGYEWLVQANATTWGLWDDVDDVNHDNTRVFRLDHSLNNANSYFVNTAGDMGLADNSVFIDRSADHLGIGTTTPGAELEISDGSPTIHLNDTGIRVWGINTYASSALFDLADVTAGTHPLVIESATPTNTLYLDNTGRVGVNNNNPAAAVHLVHPTQDVIGLFESGDAFAGFELRDSDSANFQVVVYARRNDMILRAGGQNRVWVDANGNVGFGISNPTQPIQTFTGAYLSAGGVWTNASSRSLKENIEPLSTEDALKALSQLHPVSFEYKNEPGESQLGFIAEDVPDVVATNDRKGLSPMDMVALLTKVVQVQKAENEKTVESLRSTIEGLNTRLQQLENQLAM